MAVMFKSLPFMFVGTRYSTVATPSTTLTYTTLLSEFFNVLPFILKVTLPLVTIELSLAVTVARIVVNSPAVNVNGSIVIFVLGFNVFIVIVSVAGFPLYDNGAEMVASLVSAFVFIEAVNDPSAWVTVSSTSSPYVMVMVVYDTAFVPAVTVPVIVAFSPDATTVDSAVIVVFSGLLLLIEVALAASLP